MDLVTAALSCPATKVSCGGTVDVVTAGEVTVTIGKLRQRERLTLAKGSFSLKGGARRSLTLKLDTEGRKLLAADRMLRLDVTVAAHDSYGDASTRTLAVTLRR